jgi:hypothetical protein
MNTKLQLLKLEERNLLTTWPFYTGGANSTPFESPVRAVYGNWQDTGQIHLHEGTDILVTNNINQAHSVDPGRIVGIGLVSNGYSNFVSIDSGNYGWNYLHNVVGAKPNGVAWGINDIVPADKNNILGTVSDWPQSNIAQRHLHIDFTENKPDPYFTTQGYDVAVRNMLRPTDDFLEDVNANNDNSKPVVDNIYFRIAEHDLPGTLSTQDGNKSQADLYSIHEVETNGHAYFYKTTPANTPMPNGVVGAVVIGRNAQAATGSAPNQGDTYGDGGSNVDIISNAYDLYRSAAVTTGPKIGVKAIYFSISPVLPKYGQSTGDVLSFDFSGEYTEVINRPNGVAARPHGYSTMRNFWITRSIYENDWKANSREPVHPQNGTFTDGDYFYTVSNTKSVDGSSNTKVVYDMTLATGTSSYDWAAAANGALNRKIYWNTDVALGNEWNEVTDAGSNANASTKDGFYIVKSWAEDAKGNVGTEKNQHVLIDNFTQYVNIKINDDDERWIVGGGEFIPNTYVDVWHIESGLDQYESFNRPGNYIIGSIAVDDYGNLVSPLLVTDGHALVIDYDQDGIFVPELDVAVTSRVVGRKQVPTTGYFLNSPVENIDNRYHDFPVASYSGRQESIVMAKPVQIDLTEIQRGLRISNLQFLSTVWLFEDHRLFVSKTTFPLFDES